MCPLTAQRRETGTKVQLLLSEAFKEPLHAGSDRAKSITKALGGGGGFIPKDMQPFSVVEDAGFRHMIKVPRYNIPARKHFSNTVIPELYEQTRQGIVQELSNTAYVALTTDGWTSRATESYLTVTAHYITSEWEIKSSVLHV